MAFKKNIILRILIIATIFTLLLFLYISYNELVNIHDLVKYHSQFLYLLLALYTSGFILIITGKLMEYILSLQANMNIWFLLNLFVNILLVSVLFALTGILYIRLFHSEYSVGDFLSNYSDITLKLTIIFFLFVPAYTIFDYALYAYRKLSVIQLESSRISSEQLDLQFEALKNQMSPHFLFNSLNTVSSLVYRDPNQAEDFIRKLAQTYNSVLRYHNRRVIPLSEELKLVESYGYLMSVRFEQALRIRKDIPETCIDLYVPPLSVQILVENAIKHNRLTYDNPLMIDIYTTEGYLVVKNNFIGQPSYINIENNLIENPVAGRKNRLGLQNLRNRYSYLTDKQILIERNSDFIVRIPLLKPMNDKHIL